MNMRLSGLLLLCLLCPAQSHSQSKPHLIDRGNFGLHVVPEYIYWDEYLESQNQLLLLGATTLQRLDLSGRRVIETRRITLPSLRVYGDSWLLP